MPDSPLRLALYQPDIPQNTGTMLRACACLGVAASIIEPAGFPMSDKHFRRAGMDYLDKVALLRHASFADFMLWRTQMQAEQGGHRLLLLTTQGATQYTDFAFAKGDILMVGRESAGVPTSVHALADARLKIEIAPQMRSLNVALSAAMVLGEALRQLAIQDRSEC